MRRERCYESTAERRAARTTPAPEATSEELPAVSPAAEGAPISADEVELGSIELLLIEPELVGDAGPAFEDQLLFDPAVLAARIEGLAA